MLQDLEHVRKDIHLARLRERIRETCDDKVVAEKGLHADEMGPDDSILDSVEWNHNRFSEAKYHANPLLVLVCYDYLHHVDWDIKVSFYPNELAGDGMARYWSAVLDARNCSIPEPDYMLNVRFPGMPLVVEGVYVGNFQKDHSSCLCLDWLRRPRRPFLSWHKLWRSDEDKAYPKLDIHLPILLMHPVIKIRVRTSGERPQPAVIRVRYLNTGPRREVLRLG